MLLRHVLYHVCFRSHAAFALFFSPLPPALLIGFRRVTPRAITILPFSLSFQAFRRFDTASFRRATPCYAVAADVEFRHADDAAADDISLIARRVRYLIFLMPLIFAFDHGLSLPAYSLLSPRLLCVTLFRCYALRHYHARAP